MKKIICIFIILCALDLYGQDSLKRVRKIISEPVNVITTNKPKSRLISRDNISFSDYDISFSGIEKVTGLSAKDLYNATLVWLAEHYENPQDVIRINSPEKIVIEGRFGIHITEGSDINGVLMFEYKEGRYKWSIYDCLDIDPFMRTLGYSDRPIKTLPRYNRSGAIETLIYDFSPFIESFRRTIRMYRPNQTPLPERISNDW